MLIDFTAYAAPILGGLVAMLLLCAGAILASIDPELSEAYLGDPRLLAALVGLSIVGGGVLLALHPEVAHGLVAWRPGLAFPPS